ncbi:uncharacterized protein LOC123319221 [Coccinella septempunctata]|uniref:uncharacterized protein LOC123319221 n=1 Tax=Coccinella septempunctata TaxID=41139 RepID=UPI001D0819BC|nr:uncharacterized protein LOC123319221 [Coccinella septempunctata]
MVRNYKKKGTRSGEVDEQAMSKAVNEVLKNKLSLRKSAAKYEVNAQTLQSRIKKLRETKDLSSKNRVFESKFASQQVFTKTEEDLLNKYILSCSKMHYGLSCSQVKKLAYEFAEANNIKYPASWNNNKMAGTDWLASFRKRHKNLSLRKPENTSAARSFGFNKTAVNDFFQNLENVYRKHNFTADRIFNYDESGISTVLSTPKIFADKSQKQVGQIVSAERGELVTFGGIISASGNTIPPLFIFPRVHYKDHFLEGAPEGSLGVATRSGWINSSIFVDVLKHIQKHTLSSKENPILLLCDNHESHISIEAINYCRDNGIVCLSFPPHTTHRLQPLDVGVFGPLKSKLKTAFNDWHVSNPGKTLNIYNIPKLTKIPYLESFNGRNITSAYEKTGIWPFNKLIFNDDDFAPVQVYHSNSVTNPNESTGGEEPGIAGDWLATVSAELGDVPARTSPTLSRDVSPSLQVLKTPEMIRPFPKVERRTQTKKGRSLGKSRVYTDTPEKTRIEELEKNKEMKRLEKERKSKAREIKRALSLLNEDCDKSSKPKRNKTKEIETTSSESETDVSLRESSASPFDMLEENEEEDDSEEPVDPENIKNGAYVLVKFEKKKSVIYFVGQIIEHYSLTEVMVSFLRKKPGSSMKFVFPDIKDEGSVDISNIVLILPDPESAKTARTAGILSFKKDLSFYNVH